MRRTADRLFGNAYRWSVLGAGRNQFPIAAQAIALGGNIRVGLEDSLWIGPGRLAQSNAEQGRQSPPPDRGTRPRTCDGRRGEGDPATQGRRQGRVLDETSRRSGGKVGITVTAYSIPIFSLQHFPLSAPFRPERRRVGRKICDSVNCYRIPVRAGRSRPCRSTNSLRLPRVASAATRTATSAFGHSHPPPQRVRSLNMATKTLDQAVAKAKQLPAADQRRIAEQLDRYVDELASLRAG